MHCIKEAEILCALGAFAVDNNKDQLTILPIGRFRMPFFDLPLEDLQVYRPPRQEPSDFDAFW